jgi:hypothetical protein
MQHLADFVSNNWEWILIVVTSLGGVDAIAGMLPDKLVPYVGIARRLLIALAKKGGTAIVWMVVGVGVLMTASGCASIGIMEPAPSVCDGLMAENSVLCGVAVRNGLNLETVGDFIMVGYLRLIHEGVLTKEGVASFFGDVRYALGYEISAADLKALVLEQADEYPELMLGLRYIGYLDTPEMLTSADKDMLVGWIDDQLKMLAR